MQVASERVGKLIGYARVSTEEQNLAMQEQALLKAGVKPQHAARIRALVDGLGSEREAA